ncbi:MAG: 50S ribosomal protein L11 methyltransferase [Bellilinea sp.]
MADTFWLEVSLTVDGELAEAVAEVIGRFTPQGVVMEQDVKYNDAEDLGTAYGPVRVYGYMPMDSSIEQKRQQLEEALWHLGQIQPLPEAEYRSVPDQDWMSAWKEHYRPIPIGEKILILPAWLESTYPDRLAIKIDPSMAFGTGTHPTTQLCLALLEKYVEPGKNVIDVGCGSGILSIGAVKLGAISALAVDIDSASVRATNENAIANDVEDQIFSALGSVAEILQGQYISRHAPVVVVNILAPVIVRLFNEDLAKLITPGGTIILSGILIEQATEIEVEAASHGLQLLERLTMGDWIAFAFRKPIHSRK